MNSDFPVLRLAAPERAKRKSERPRPVPTDPRIVRARRELARRARAQLEPASQRLAALTDAERRAVFYKLEHDGPISLSGTGLKKIADSRGRFTLAVPKEQDLSRFLEHIDNFEEGEIRFGKVPSADRVGNLVSFAEGAPTDRLSGELSARFANLVTQQDVIVEIELSSFAHPAKRKKELDRIQEELVTAFNNGQHGAILEHEDVDGTRRAVIRCSGAMLRTLVEAPKWQLAISWFEARPKFQTFKEVQEEFSLDRLGRFVAPDDEASTVCVLDSGITANNPFVAPVVKKDLLKSFVAGKLNDPSDEFGHGTGVASLVAYFAINLADGAQNTAHAWIAGGRILDEENDLPERLFSKVLREAISHYAPLGIKIFNLSVNIRNRTWSEDQKRTVPRNSWIARAVDKLVREFDVVFVVSTGNLTLQDVNELHREADYPLYLAHIDASLLDPAQAALALTVGSRAGITLVAGDPRAQPMAPDQGPCPITRAGPGISDEVKPELVDLDGNLAFDISLGRARQLRSLQVAAASNSVSPPIVASVGTSYAAARVSHKLARVYRDITLMGIDEVSAPLLKAFLVNSVDLRAPDSTGLFVGSDQLKQLLCGYGIADAEKATGCDDYTAIMFYQGAIKPDEIVFFEVPVPAALVDSGASKKRMSVTVVFHPEVQRWGLEEYLGIRLRWKMYRGDKEKDAIVAELSEPEDESVADGANRADDLHFEPGIRQRSRGCVQHATTEWTQHRAEFADNHYTLAVVAHDRWDRKQQAALFAVVIRLEERGRTTEIYSDVQETLVELEVTGRV